MAPLVADARFGFEDREANASARQLVCSGEAGLAPADYDRLQLLNSTHLIHLSIDALITVIL
jgi:hypothetical protein